MIEPQAHKRDIEVTFPHFDKPIFIHADRTHMKQILINPLSNAIKYNRASGSIVVRCICGTERIRICVEDKGKGCRLNKLHNCFNHSTVLVRK